MRYLNIEQTREMLRTGRLRVVEHVETTLADIRDVDPDLGAFISVAGDEALRDAEAADKQIRTMGGDAWQDRPLLGTTIAVKDLIQTRDLPTTRGSLVENRRVRADAPAVARLRAAGAIVVGKTTTSEFGWSASTVSRVAPPTRNPWHRQRSAGGSSGGAAAAVAAGLCTAALGTDGAGSIRIPAAFCGVVGFKPTFGRVPYVPPGVERLAHVGSLSTCVEDAVELLAVLAGPHRNDPDSAAEPAPAPALSTLRIAWVEFPGTASEVSRVSGKIPPLLIAQGHHVEHLPAPFADPYPALVDILSAAEAASTEPADEPRYDPDRLAVVQHGRAIGAVRLMRAEQARLALRVALGSLMERYDLLAMATVPVEPFDRDAIAPTWASRPEDLQWLAWSPATYPFNMTGQPALSLPVGLTETGLPVGLQLVGPAGGDQLVLSAGRRIEADLDPLPRVLDRVAKG